MKLSEHVVYSSTIATWFVLGAFIVSGGNALLDPALKAGLFLLGAVALDVDHYLWWALKARPLPPFDLRAVPIWFSAHKKLEFIFPLHTIEFYVIALVVAIFMPVLMPAFFGITFHLVTDVISDMVRCRHVRDLRLYRVLKERKICFGERSQ